MLGGGGEEFWKCSILKLKMALSLNISGPRCCLVYNWKVSLPLFEKIKPKNGWPLG